MFVGYFLNHAGDTVRMWDPDTKRVHLSRDILWTGRMYFDSMQKTLEVPFIHPILKNKNNNEINDEVNDEISDEINDDMNNEKKESNNENNDVEEKTRNKVSVNIEDKNQIKTRSGRIIKKPERYQMIWEQQMSMKLSILKLKDY
jgi:hypothetical protein